MRLALGAIEVCLCLNDVEGRLQALGVGRAACRLEESPSPAAIDTHGPVKKGAFAAAFERITDLHGADVRQVATMMLLLERDMREARSRWSSIPPARSGGPASGPTLPGPTHGPPVSSLPPRPEP